MSVLASIALTTPLMLGGLALLALPVLAHLLNRRVRRPLVFPTIRLLTESWARQSALFKLRRWILLAVRCLAVALVVYAFTRPVWVEPGSAPPAAGGGAAVVVVVDASASVGRQSGGVALSSAVQAAASRVLESLTPGADLAGIVYATAHPRSALPQLSPNIAVLKDDLAGFRPSLERADLPAAAALAGQLLKSPGGQRRLVIVSDMQQTNWTELASARRLVELLPPGTRLTVVPVDDPAAANLGLAEPACVPPTALVGQAVQLQVRLANYGAQERAVRVDCVVDDQPMAAQSMSIKPLEQRPVSFETVLHAPGEHRVYFSIGADALEADNRAHLVVPAAARPTAVLVADDDVNQPGSAGYFLLRALAPRGDAADPFEVRRLTSADVSDAALAGASCVVVGDCGPLASGAATALRRLAEAGAGVLLLAIDGPAEANLRAIAAGSGPGAGVPPLSLGAVRELASGGDFAQITAGDWQARALRDFDQRSQVALGQVRFGRVRVIAGQRDDVRVLLRFADGTAALAAAPLGEGRLLLANFSPALSASDFGKYGCFVALMQSLAHDLEPRAGRWRQALVGQGLALTALPEGLDAGRATSVVGPDGRPVSVDVARQGPGLLVQVPATDQPGFYRLVDAGRTLAVAAVNVDPRESDLRPADAPALQQQAAAAGLATDVRQVDEARPVLEVRGRPLWHWFVVAAMVGLGVEMVLTAIWRR